MIGRFLASTAVAGVLFTGAAMAQMSAPPPNNAPSDQPARIQTQNPGPRDQANPTTTPAMNKDQQNRDQIGQAGTSTTPSNSSTSTSGSNSSTKASSGDQRTLGQKMGDSMRHAGQKVKSAFSSDKSSNKQSAQGHNMDNIADQLNACQAKPQAERQGCMDQATRM